MWETDYVSPELTENLAELFPGLTLDEALQHQESLYQSLKISCVNHTDTSRSSDNGQSSSQGHSWGEASLSGSGDYDLDLDEALARSLQELDLEEEVDLVAVTVTQPVHNVASNSERAAEGSSVSRANQDDIDPDRMTYEELQSLGDSIGSESKGLSEAEISSLPCYKYKGGFFTKKVEIGECAVCYEAYKNKQSVTSLPCLHQYHTKCITCWLKQSKACPICQKEVKLS